MKIAVSSNFFSNSHVEGIDKLGDFGFNAVELICEKPHENIYNTQSIKLLNKLKKKFDLDLIVHAPFYGLNGAAWNDGVRQETVRQYKEAIKLAKEIDSKIVVIHLGIRSAGFMDKTEALARNHQTLQECVGFAEDSNVLLALENVGNSPMRLFDTIQDMINIIKKISSSHLRATFDIGHAVIQKLNLYNSILELAPYLEHVHIHDNFGINDEHLPLNNGTINFSPAFKALKKIKYNKTITMEILNRNYLPNVLLESKEFILKKLE